MTSSRSSGDGASATKRIAKYVSRFLAAVAIALAACDGGGGGTTHTPSIANLRYSPTTAFSSPTASINITGTVDFSDEGGDIAAVRIAAPLAGVDLTIPTPQLNGVRSGSGSVTLTASAAAVGRYEFQVWAIDGAGNASNRVSGTFEIVLDDRGESWRAFSSPALQGRILYAVTSTGQQYVAVGFSGSVVTSPDATIWTVRQSGLTATLRSIAWSGAQLVAVGDDTSGNAVIFSSPDGVAWTLRHRAGVCQAWPCTSPAALTKVIWAGTQFVAVGQETLFAPGGTSSLYALILTSPDGLVWTQRAEAILPLAYAGTEFSVAGLAWSGTTLVAVGSSGWTSQDGVTWTERALAGGLRSVTWGMGRFVAIGLGGVAYSSTDGVTWQLRAGTQVAMSAITAGPNRYVALSNIYRATSSDLQQWAESPAFDPCGNDVIWSGDRYVSVGGVVCVSP